MIPNDATIPETSRQVPVWLAIVAFGLLLRVPYLFHRMQDVDEGSHAAIATVCGKVVCPFATQ